MQLSFLRFLHVINKPGVINAESWSSSRRVRRGGSSRDSVQKTFRRVAAVVSSVRRTLQKYDATVSPVARTLQTVKNLADSCIPIFGWHRSGGEPTRRTLQIGDNLAAATLSILLWHGSTPAATLRRVRRSAATL